MSRSKIYTQLRPKHLLHFIVDTILPVLSLSLYLTDLHPVSATVTHFPKLGTSSAVASINNLQMLEIELNTSFVIVEVISEAKITMYKVTFD